MRRYFRFALIAWFITAYPRTSKLLVLLAALALIVGMYLSAVKR
jgi:hypothetical protein